MKLDTRMMSRSISHSGHRVLDNTPVYVPNSLWELKKTKDFLSDSIPEKSGANFFLKKNRKKLVSKLVFSKVVKT